MNDRPPVDDLDLDVCADLLGALNEQQRMVVTLRLGLDGNCPETLERIGKKIGKHRERVRQIQNYAFAKMRRRLQYLRVRKHLGLKIV